MKFVREMFNNKTDGSGGVFYVGNINEIKNGDGKVTMILGLIDSSFGKRNKLYDLNDINIIETDNDNWSLDSFDGVDSWIMVSKWIDFRDLDGDFHHGRLVRFWDPDKPTDIHYYLEVDLLSEPS